VKVVADKSSRRILGMHAVGHEAFDILQEGVLAIEMGARLEDVVLTLHPHPTLCEAVREACADALGESTNVMERNKALSGKIPFMTLIFPLDVLDPCRLLAA